MGKNWVTFGLDFLSRYFRMQSSEITLGIFAILLIAIIFNRDCSLLHEFLLGDGLLRNFCEKLFNVATFYNFIGMFMRQYLAKQSYDTSILFRYSFEIFTFLDLVAELASLEATLQYAIRNSDIITL